MMLLLLLVVLLLNSFSNFAESNNSKMVLQMRNQIYDKKEE
jgi:hypothetical protein